jgi:pantetheine-phosphate adenylyltransferase
MILLFPGSFDPPHLGHLDVIRRGATLAEEVILAVGVNPDKKPLLDLDRRMALLRDICAGIARVRVVSYQGSTFAFARAQGAHALLRGVRGMADLEHEATMASIHRRLGLESVLLLTDDALAHISSRAVRLAISASLPLAGLVPESVARALNTTAR